MLKNPFYQSNYGDIATTTLDLKSIIFITSKEASLVIYYYSLNMFSDYLWENINVLRSAILSYRFLHPSATVRWVTSPKIPRMKSSWIVAHRQSFCLILWKSYKVLTNTQHTLYFSRKFTIFVAEARRSVVYWKVFVGTLLMHNDERLSPCAELIRASLKLIWELDPCKYVFSSKNYHILLNWNKLLKNDKLSRIYF